MRRKQEKMLLLPKIYNDGITINIKTLIKGFVHYIVVSLFCIYKREHLWNKEKCFWFYFNSSIHPWDDQILTFQVFKWMTKYILQNDLGRVNTVL